MAQTNIVQWSQSKYGFYVDRYYSNGKWILQNRPIKLADYHGQILNHIFKPDNNGHLPYDVVAWCEPAKSGKSAIAGLVAEYVALHGESNSQIIMASNKQQQAASLMFRSLVDSVSYNPHLPNVEPGRLSVTFANGNEVKAIASNSRGEAGARFSLSLFDELWAYVYQDSERLWTEFKTDPTRLNSIKMALGYAGYLGEGELWQNLLDTGIQGEPVLTDITNQDGKPACYANGRQFTFWSHVCRQPWQTDQWIESQRATLRPAEFARMILTEFAEGIGNFCEPSDWAACIQSEHSPLPPGRRQAVYVGLDLATSGGGDNAALVGVYSDNKKVKLAFHKVWDNQSRRKIKGAREGQDRLKLKSTVFPYLLELKKKYRISALYFDPYQALSLAEDLRKAGMRCREVTQTHASRGPKDTGLLDLVHTQKLVLYQHPDIKNLSSQAQSKELGNGQIFLRKASGRSRIDLLIALSNCASEANRPRGWVR